MWFAAASVCVLWAVAAALGGTGVSAPLLIGALTLFCGVNAEARRWAGEKLSWAFSGSALRFVLVMIGVMMLWQTVGLELALFAAGDVLAYLEVLTAVSLMTAQVRLAPVRAAMAGRMTALLQPLRRLKSRIRARRIRPKTPPSSSDADGPAGVWAFA
ncbi:MAG: hypothetical protein J0I52_14230 [Bordetella sp.]|nr:hypothetical protein [Bordetella sp.]